MVEFITEYPFALSNKEKLHNWVVRSIEKLGFEPGDITYFFVDDARLLEINLQYLNHDTYTDIISFDYTVGKVMSGEIYISVERVKENSGLFGQSITDELHRVMIHGILHFAGYDDHTPEDKKQMRESEDYYLSLRDF
jgi:rRNA maturation RNase YbeY